MMRLGFLEDCITLQKFISESNLKTIPPGGESNVEDTRTSEECCVQKVWQKVSALWMETQRWKSGW